MFHKYKNYLFMFYLALLSITIMINILVISLYHSINPFLGFMSLCVLVLLVMLSAFVILQYNKNEILLQNKSVNLNLKNLLYELLEESSHLETREALFQLILEKAIKALPNVYKGSILKMDNQHFVFQAAIGFDMQLLKSVHLKIEETYLYKETNGRLDCTVIIKNSSNYNKDSVEEENQVLLNLYGMETVKTTICTPIQVDGKLWGMINADSEIENAFTEEDIRSFEIFAFEVEKVIKLYDSLEANQYLLNFDTLTQINNRRSFNEYVETYMASLNKQDIYSLVSIDLNDLKRINDTYGHHHGDRLLVTFTNIMKKHLRADDFFARYGGDEFVVLIKGLHYDEVKMMMEATETDLEEGLIIDGYIEIITFSFGIVEYPKDGTEISQLLKKADLIMYEDKRLKRIYYNKVKSLEKYDE